jgi:hypothetical protein
VDETPPKTVGGVRVSPVMDGAFTVSVAVLETLLDVPVTVTAVFAATA